MKIYFRFLIAIVVFCFSCFFIAGCLEQKKVDSDPFEQWKIEAALDEYEDPEELYQAALKEDTLIIYSISTRMMDVKESFEKEYPGLTVFIYDMRTGDLFDMLKENHASQNYVCDIIFASNNNGDMYNELFLEGLLQNYVPPDIGAHIKPEDSDIMLNVLIEIMQLFYNSDLYEQSPVSNWWQITESRFYNRIIMSNPHKSISTLGILSVIYQDEEILMESYTNYFGHNYDQEEPIGKYFLRLLAAQNPVIINSSDEAVELLGSPGQNDYDLAFILSSKARESALGYRIEPIFEIEPFTGTYSPNCVMIASGSPNINSAKLFIRWLMGESDGQGEGYKPYLQRGAWSVRDDIDSDDPLRIDDIKTVQIDTDFIFFQREEILSFWNEVSNTQSSP